MLHIRHSCLMAAILFGLFFSLWEISYVSASCPNYRGQRAAWGGNGGWWGGGNDDFYDDFPWRTQDISCSPRRVCKPRYYPCSHCVRHRSDHGRYRYRASHTPSCEAAYEETVPGAGLYLDLEPERCRY